MNEDKNEKWFGLKITWQDFEIFYETGLFKTLFKDAKYIYLDRFDIEAQAVSLQHAIVTHKWHFTDESEDNFNFNEEDIKNQFNLIKLCNLIDKLKKEKENWQTFLYNIQEPPLYLYHELFLKDNKTALNKIFNFLNVKVEIEVDSAIVNSDYKKVKKPGYDNWLYKLKMFRTGNLFLNQKTDQK